MPDAGPGIVEKEVNELSCSAYQRDLGYIVHLNTV